MSLVLKLFWYINNIKIQAFNPIWQTLMKIIYMKHYVVGEVPIWVPSSKGGALEGVSLMVFPNLRKTHKYMNLPLCKQLFWFPPFFLISEKTNISMGTWKHIKLGELPQRNTLRFFCWGKSLKIHTQIKRELFTLWKDHPLRTSHDLDCVINVTLKSPLYCIF